MKKRILAVVLAVILVFGLAGCDSADYEQAMQLYEKGLYTQAAMVFQSLGDYRDSREMVGRCHYQSVVQTMVSGDYVAAQSLLDTNPSIPDRELLAERLKYETLILSFLSELGDILGRTKMAGIEIVSAKVYDGGPLNGTFSDAADGAYPMAIVELRSEEYLTFPVVVGSDGKAITSAVADHWYCSSNIKDGHLSLGCLTLDQVYYAASTEKDLPTLTQEIAAGIFRTAYASNALIYECTELSQLTDMMSILGSLKVDISRYSY